MTGPMAERPVILSTPPDKINGGDSSEIINKYIKSCQKDEVVLGPVTNVALLPGDRITLIREVCWFITLLIDGYPLTMLLDTGAGRTMVAQEVFQEIKESQPELSLTKARVKLVTASGDTLPVQGAHLARMEVAGHVVKHNVLVANLGATQGVLGMDFLGKCSGPIELSTGLLSFGGAHVYLHRESQAKGFVVAATKLCTIPPGDEAVVRCSKGPGRTNYFQSPWPKILCAGKGYW